MSMRYWFIVLMMSMFLHAESETVQIEELPTPDAQVFVTPSVLMIDDFEDSNFTKFREWWVFDKVIIQPVETEGKKRYLGKFGMKVSASSNNWYAGGIGTYLSEDARYFDYLKIVLYSPKRNSGSIRIELYDDDNNNEIVDIDKDTDLPSKDDIFVYDVNLMWTGWKVLTIPIREFVDYNDTVGDNIWNPNKMYGSSGLLQMQIIVLSSKFESEMIEFVIDTIKFN